MRTITRRTFMVFGGACVALAAAVEFWPDCRGLDTGTLIPVGNHRGEWGFVNEEGEVVIPLENTACHPFSESGYAPVARGGKWTWMDRSGTLLTPPMAGMVLDFDDQGMALFRTENPLEMVGGPSQGPTGFVNLAGEVVIDPLWHTFDFHHPHFHGGSRFDDGPEGGVISVQRLTEEGLRMDSTLPYEEIYDPVTDELLVPLRVGLMNRRGEMVVPMEWEALRPTGSGAVWARRGGLWGLIDREGKILAEPRWTEWQPFRQGCAWVRATDGRWGAIDTSGRMLVDAKWDWVEPVGEGMAQVGTGAPDNAGVTAFLVDASGNILSPPGGAAWFSKSGFSEELIAFRAPSGKWGFMNARGEVALPAQWGKTFGFQWGRARGYKDGRWELFDREGKILGTWDFISSIQPVTYVRNAGKEGCINLDGEVMVPLVWDEVAAWSNADGSWSVRRGELWGLVDRTGRVIVNPMWDDVEVPAHTRPGAKVLRRGNRVEIIDARGKVLVPLSCGWTDAQVLNHEGHLVGFHVEDGSSPTGASWAILNREGEPVVSGGPIRRHCVNTSVFSCNIAFRLRIEILDGDPERGPLWRAAHWCRDKLGIPAPPDEDIRYCEVWTPGGECLWSGHPRPVRPNRILGAVGLGLLACTTFGGRGHIAR